MSATWPEILNQAQKVSWETLEPKYQKLIDEPLSEANLESWLIAWSDIDREVFETYMALMRAKDEDTQNKDAESNFSQFVSTAMPKGQEATQLLKEKVLPFADQARSLGLTEVIKTWQNEADLFSESNLNLSADITKLANEYNKLTGSVKIALEGEELTIPEAQVRLESEDRAVRQAAWQAIEAAMQTIRSDLDELFLELVKMRRQLAKNASEPDFRAYAWRSYNRFDYSPQDNLALHEAIKSELAPLARKLRTIKAETLNIKALRPWDIKADANAQKPLKPFEGLEELEEGLARIFSKLDKRLETQFNGLRDGWLDLENREGKVPNLGYCATFYQSGNAYIYHSVTGSHADLWTMMHEMGHAFHSLAANNQTFVWNQQYPSEFAEVASQAMELMTMPYWSKEQGGFYTEEDAKRARLLQIEMFVNRFIGTAKHDAMQHWLYTEAPEHVTSKEIDTKWLEICAAFNDAVDWSGLEDSQAKGWQIVHLYQFPFYMLDYAIAMLGAIEIWQNSLDDQEKALTQYLEALALGGTRPLADLFAAAGANLSFERKHVAGLAQFLEQQLEL